MNVLCASALRQHAFEWKTLKNNGHNLSGKTTIGSFSCLSFFNCTAIWTLIWSFEGPFTRALHLSLSLSLFANDCLKCHYWWPRYIKDEYYMMGLMGESVAVFFSSRDLRFVSDTGYRWAPLAFTSACLSLVCLINCTYLWLCLLISSHCLCSLAHKSERPKRTPSIGHVIAQPCDVLMI